MTEAVQVTVHTRAHTNPSTVEVIQGGGGKDQPTRIQASKDARYQLQHAANPTTAPQSISAKRIGKNLYLSWDGGGEADLIVEGYYDALSGTDASSNIYSQLSDDGIHEYVAGNSGTSIAQLSDGGDFALQVLSTEAVAGFELSGLPFVTSALSSNLGLGLAGLGAVAATTTALKNNGEVPAQLLTLRDAAQNNTASEPAITAKTYADAGVTDANVDALNSALNSDAIRGEQVSSREQLQAIVEAYNNIFAEAASPTEVDPTSMDFILVGVTNVSKGPQLQLLNDALHGKSGLYLSSVANLQRMADGAQAVQDGTATVEQLQALGISGANAQNLTSIRAALKDSSGVSDISTLQNMVNNANDAPVLAAALGDQYATANNAFSYSVPTNSFTDSDNPLTYSATLADGSALPSWLSFDPSAQKFSGNAPANPNGRISSLSVKVTASDGTLSVSDVFDIRIDPGSPKITEVAITGATGKLNNFLNANDEVTTSVTFDQQVTVTGEPRIKLNIGGRSVDAVYSAGAGTSVLTFSCTINDGNNDSNGISLDANSLSLNGGTIKNANNEAALLTYSAVADNADYKVDTSVLNASVTAASGDNLLTAFEPLVLSGTAEANSTVTVTLADGTLTTITADSRGAWQLAPTAIAHSNASAPETVQYIMVRRQNSASSDAGDALAVFNLDEIQVMSGGLNIAAGKPVKLSWDPAHATNDLTDENIHAQSMGFSTFVETLNNGDVWVQLDLGAPMAVDSITVASRLFWAIRYVGAEVYVSDQDMSGMTLQEVQATNAKRALISEPSRNILNSTFTMDLAQPSVSSLTLGGDLTYQYQVTDLAGNVSATVSQTVQIDSEHPTASISSAAASYTSLDTITVRSSHVGKAYLVFWARWVSDEASITNLDTSAWNSVDITRPNTDFTMSLAGLMSGGYTLFTASQSGNLSYVTADTLPIMITKDAPILDTTQSPAMTDVAVTAALPNAGDVVGTLVSDLVSGISNADTAVGKGIAITGVNSTHGTLWFSIDNGVHWQEATDLSNTHALLLKADAGHRIYYVPNSGTTAGTTDDAVTFRAWDGTMGRRTGVRELIDGLQVDISSQLDPASSVTLPFSLETDTISVTVIAAPVVANINQDSVAMDVSGDGHLNLLGADINLDLTRVLASHGAISSVDVNGTGANTFTINLAVVLPSTTLKVQGGSDDTVALFHAEGWSTSGTATDAGVVYNVWHSTSSAEQLLIDQHLNVTTA
jgi:hypothetical protein